jgi:NADPH:quinone reductase-like Zn-dependent oxidoreductase
MSGPPTTFRAWQYTSARGGLEKNLTLNPAVPLPTAKANQHLIKVVAVALNPVDYKVPEVLLIRKLAVPRVATPGIDFSGRIVTPASGSKLKAGQLVFGAPSVNVFTGGALREYLVADDATIAPAPDGLSAVDVASIPIAGLYVLSSSA